MKKLIAIAALATAALATPAFAGTLTGEVKFNDVRGGNHANGTSYKLDYMTNVVGNIVAGGELQVSQPEDGGAAKTRVTVKAGYTLPEALGIHAVAYGELSEAFKAGDNYELWGAGVKASHHVYGPVSVVAGYRHREGFKDAYSVNTERLNAGLSYEVREGTSVAANYYRTRGTANIDAIGVAVAQKF
jgi:hypothetical protein